MRLYIFEFDDYKAYLNTLLANMPKRGYGFKTRMAEAARCRTAYVAQVLNGSAHFSLEQAEDINVLLGHSEDEAEFFLLLVQYGRAGTDKLKHRLSERMNQLRKNQTNLKQRFKIEEALSEDDLVRFFSHWSIAAVQIGATIQRLATRADLQRALGMDRELFEEALNFLFSRGLIAESDGRLKPGPTRIFIGRDSPIMKLHHANWRHKAIESLDHIKDDDLHLTSLYSLSRSDANQIRESLIRQIEQTRAVVKRSAEEELYAFSVDFFRLDS